MTTLAGFRVLDEAILLWLQMYGSRHVHLPALPAAARLATSSIYNHRQINR